MVDISMKSVSHFLLAGVYWHHGFHLHGMKQRTEFWSLQWWMVSQFAVCHCALSQVGGCRLTPHAVKAGFILLVCVSYQLPFCYKLLTLSTWIGEKVPKYTAPLSKLIPEQAHFSHSDIVYVHVRSRRGQVQRGGSLLPVKHTAHVPWCGEMVNSRLLTGFLSTWLMDHRHKHLSR